MQLVFSWTSLKICLLPICVEQKFLLLYGTAEIRGPIFSLALLMSSNFANLCQLKGW